MPRKKKETEIIISAEVAESLDTVNTDTEKEAKAAIKKAKKDTANEVWPKVVVGNHLTVKTFEDGSTELIWDDAALAKEVKEAIESYELENLKPAVKAKVANRKKKNLVK